MSNFLSLIAHSFTIVAQCIFPRFEEAYRQRRLA